jgi:GntR family transcriptional regulator
MTNRPLQLIRFDAFSDGFRLDPTNPLPLYQQLKTFIKQKITNGHWRPDQVIPSEKEFSTNYHIAPGTVRMAINALVQEAVLYRKQGKGTFVASPYSPGYVRFFRFPDEGKKGLRAVAKIIGIKTELAREEISQILQIGKNGQVIMIRRLRPNPADPILLEDIYLPADAFPNFDQNDLTEDPIYTDYAEKYGVQVINIHDYYTPKLAEGEVASLLAIPSGAPVMFIERISLDRSNRPVEYRQCHGRGDLFRFHIALGEDRRSHQGDLYWDRWSLSL